LPLLLPVNDQDATTEDQPDSGRDDLGFLRPVASLCRTSRRTRAGSRGSFSCMNRRTASGSRFPSARSAHDRAFTTIASRSSVRSVQIRMVRRASPRPPLAATLSGTVLTSAARRHQRSSDFAHAAIAPSSICPSRQAGPARQHAKQSTWSQLDMPDPRRSIARRSRVASASGRLAMSSSPMKRGTRPRLIKAAAILTTSPAGLCCVRAVYSRRSARSARASRLVMPATRVSISSTSSAVFMSARRPPLRPAPRTIPVSRRPARRRTGACVSCIGGRRSRDWTIRPRDQRIETTPRSERRMRSHVVAPPLVREPRTARAVMSLGVSSPSRR
jgi:hypothetical protein